MTVARLPDPLPTSGDAEIDALLSDALRATPKKRETSIRILRLRFETLLTERNDALEAVKRGPRTAVLEQVATERETSEREAQAEANRSATADRFTEELARVYPALNVTYRSPETIAARLGDALTYPSTWRLPDGLTDALSEVARVARIEASESMEEELQGEVKEANAQLVAAEEQVQAVAEPGRRVAGALLAIIGIVDREGDNTLARSVRADAERILRETSGVCWTSSVGEYEAAWRDAR